MNFDICHLYALLSEREQEILQRLSVFAGGASLEAAETACVDQEIESIEVLDTISRLVDKSLVTAGVSEHGETRYALLETIRQFALEKLEKLEEKECVQNRHLDFFLQFAEVSTFSGEPHLIKSAP